MRGSLQAVLEKSIALCLAASNTSATTALADLLANYVLRLVDQGAMRSAMTYLGLLGSIPPDAAPALAVLRDRVAQAAAAEVCPRHRANQCRHYRSCNSVFWCLVTL